MRAWLAALTLVLFAAVPAPAAASGDERPVRERQVPERQVHERHVREHQVFERLVAAILAGIVPPARVAIEPVTAGATGLPDAVAGRIALAIDTAFLAVARRGVSLIARETLAAAWREAAEFRGASVAQLVADAGADVLLSADVLPAEGGVELSLAAVSVRPGRVGRMLARSGPAFVAEPGIARQPVGLQQAAARIAGHLAAAAVPALAGRGVAPGEAAVLAAAAAHPFASYLAEAIRERLIAGLAEGSPLAPPEPFRRETDPIMPGPGATLLLRLDVWDLRTAVTVTAGVELDGRRLASRGASLDASAIPAQFLPLTRDGGRLGGGRVAAEGRALAGPGLGMADARQGARLLARARAVAAALRLPPPPVGLVRDGDDMFLVARAFERGVPQGAVWQAPATEAGGHAGAALGTAAAPVGGGAAPPVAVTPGGARLCEGATLALRVTGERRRAYVSVFAWQADDGVVRLYPGRRAETFPVDAGGRLVLPGLGEPAYGVAPLPGEAASHEALIVLAGAAPYDPDRLAPPALGSAGARLRAGASSARGLPWPPRRPSPRNCLTPSRWIAS